MIKTLKLQKAVFVLVLGLASLLLSWLMGVNSIKGDKFVLGVSGALLIIGAVMFLVPILFAKKVNADDNVVELGGEGAEEDTKE